MEVNAGDDGAVEVRLTPGEARRLRVALQRALFEDVPPQQLGAALDVADQLLKELQAAGGGEESAS